MTAELKALLSKCELNINKTLAVALENEKLSTARLL